MRKRAINQKSARYYEKGSAGDLICFSQSGFVFQRKDCRLKSADWQFFTQVCMHMRMRSKIDIAQNQRTSLSITLDCLWWPLLRYVYDDGDDLD